MSEISFISKLVNFLKPEIEDPNSKSNDVGEYNGKIDDEVEIRKSFVIQFAENQNHQQKLFIQFLSSVLFVIIAFGFVYTNTATKTGIKVYSAQSSKEVISTDSSAINNIIDTLKKNEHFDSLIVFADTRSAKKNSEGSILSFSIMNLLGIYTFSQIVLLILITMILHMGYSYRRDQLVVYRIRKNSLTEFAYEKIFGKKSYNPADKNAYDFLPNFNIIIFMAIFLIQVTLFISMIIYFEDRSTEVFDKFGNTTINYEKLSYSLGLPLLVNVFLYVYYFNRYQWTVNRKKTYLPEIDTLDFTKTELNLFKFIWPLAISIIIVGNIVYFKIIHIWTLVAFSLIIYLSVFLNRILFIVFKKEKRPSKNNDTHKFYYKSVQGLIYSIFGFILFCSAAKLYFIQYNSIENTSFKYLLLFFIPFLLLLKFPNWYLKYTSHNNTKGLHLYNFIRKHYAYYYFMLVYLMLIWFTQLKWLDTLITVFFGIYSCIVGRRIFLEARTHLYENRGGLPKK